MVSPLSVNCGQGTYLLLGIAIGMMFTISPLWIGETCRPELRGFFLCFFNTSIVFGQFAMLASFLLIFISNTVLISHRVVVSKGGSYLTGKWQVTT